nr:hypothetical protein [Tepidiforma sp.]
MPALEHDRRPRLPTSSQEAEVLHVPGADLDDIGVFADGVDIADAHELGNDGEAVGLAGGVEVAEAFFAEAAEGVGGGAGLEGAAAEDVGAGGFDGAGGIEDVLFVFDGAGAGHDGELGAADFDAVADVDDGIGGMEVAGGELVGAGDAVDGFDAGEREEDVFEAGLIGADDADDACAPVPTERWAWRPVASTRA